MQNTLAYQLIQTFTKRDIREARKWLASPCHNQREGLPLLFEQLAAAAPEGQPFSREQAWAALYPNQTYDDQQLRLHLSYLYRCLEDFLLQQGPGRRPGSGSTCCSPPTAGGDWKAISKRPTANCTSSSRRKRSARPNTTSPGTGWNRSAIRRNLPWAARGNTTYRSWAEHFLHHYRSYLEPEQQEAAFSLNAARLAFARRQYGQVLAHLQRADCDNFENLCDKR